MGCGCGAQPQGEQWEVVNADRTVSKPMTKAEATAEAQGRNGSWIREVKAAAAV